MSGLIERIATIDHDRLGRLRLRSAWPRSPDRLVLEYRTPDDGCVAAQWNNEPDRLRDVQRVIEEHCDGGDRCDLVSIDGERVLLQPYGLDDRLRSLASVVARKGSTLLSHRAGRRAVVLQQGPEGALEYTKVLRQKKLAAITSRYQIAENSLTSFRVPRIRSVDERLSAVVLSSVPGVPLDHCDMQHFISTMPAVGRALRDLHDVRFENNRTELDVYDSVQECAVLQEWCDHAAHYVPDTTHHIESRLSRVIEELCRIPMVSDSLVHRDFHEKQIMLDGEEVGVIDLDTLCVGDPMLDLGNFVAHLELRWRTQNWPKDAQLACIQALNSGYGDFDRAALDIWTSAARLRLVCIHAFRP